jgi:hypothetical protein
MVARAKGNGDNGVHESGIPMFKSHNGGFNRGSDNVKMVI